MGEIELITDEMPFLLPMENRSQGIHVSEVIHDLCVSMGHYEVRGEGIDPPSRIRMELGNTFEWAMINRMQENDPDRFIQPGELYFDGLYGTPDLYDYRHHRVHEMKLTWMSAKHGPESDKYLKYWWQIKAYAKMMNVLEARLMVCHIRGLYNGDGPKYFEWHSTFTPLDLARNWAMLKARARALDARREL